MMIAAHTVISCCSMTCEQRQIVRVAINYCNNINGLSFYHLIRWNLEKESGDHGKTPSYRWSNEGIVPGFQMVRISRKLEVHGHTRPPEEMGSRERQRIEGR